MIENYNNIDVYIACIVMLRVAKHLYYRIFRGFSTTLGRVVEGACPRNDISAEININDKRIDQ